MAKRTLHRPQAVVNQCLACNWRQFSNKSLKELIKLNPDFPPNYSGILVGFLNGSLTFVTFQNGKQVAFTPVPMAVFEGVRDEATAVFERELAKLAAELEEVAEANGDEPSAEPVESEDDESEDEEEDEDDPLAELRLLVSAESEDE